MHKDVSIVIPTFNRADRVGKAITSCLEQTRPCQIIVCDHGSGDDTPRVVGAFGDKVLYIRRERDFGPHFCWLEGVLHADADYVHLQFDDDYLHPEFVQATMPLFDDNVGFVCSDASLVVLDTGTIATRRLLQFKEYGLSGKIRSLAMEEYLVAHKKMISPAACIFRKRDLIDALYQGELPLPFRASYHGAGPDFFMSLLALLRYPYVGCITAPLAMFGVHDSSITIDASRDPEKEARLAAGYDAVRLYYLMLRGYVRNRGATETQDGRK